MLRSCDQLRGLSSETESPCFQRQRERSLAFILEQLTLKNCMHPMNQFGSQNQLWEGCQPWEGLALQQVRQDCCS